MKKIILFLSLFLSTILTAQQPLCQQEEMELLLSVPPFFHLSIYTPLNDEVYHNVPVRDICVNKEGDFYRLDPPISELQKIYREEWDSLGFYTINHLTFLFKGHIQKEQYKLETGKPGYKWIGNTEGLFINGKKEGIWRKEMWYCHDDTLTCPVVIIEPYKEGKLHGIREIYNYVGKKISGSLFIHGTGHYNQYYYDTEKKAVSGFLIYGKPHGEWKYYNKDSKLIKKEMYKHGLLHGPFIIYNSEGDILYETYFRNGTGNYRSYYNDELLEKGPMLNGSRNGEWTINTYTFNSYKKPQFYKETYTQVYTPEDPINNPSNIIDTIFSEGEFIIIRATEDNK